MWKRFKCDALLFIILLILFENASIWVCGDSDLAAATTASSNGKRQSMIPLRDNNDYDQSEKDFYEPEYDDEYDTFDGEQYTDMAGDNDVSHKILLKAKHTNNDDSAERLIDAENIPTVELSTAMVSPTSTATSTEIELCPKECSCLNDFMDCIRLNLDQLPHVPQWVLSL